MSNAVILLILLIIMALITYTLNGKQFLSAWFVVTVMFILSTACQVCFPSVFTKDITSSTIIAIIVSICALGFGEMLSSNMVITIGGTRSHDAVSQEPYPIKIPNKIIVFITVLLIIDAALSFYYLFKFSLSVGNPGELFKTISYTRDYATAGAYKENRIISWIGTIGGCFARYFLFVYLYNRIICGVKNTRLLFPYIAEMLTAFSSTGRSQFIFYISYFVVLYVVITGFSTDWSTSKNKKIIKVAILSLLLFFGIFSLIGNMRTRYGLEITWMEKFSSYLGASLYGIGEMIENGGGATSKYIGQETFKWFYNILSGEFGIELDISTFTPFFYWGNFSSNAFSALRAPYVDFGYAGMIIFQFLIGFIYGVWKSTIKRIQDVRSSGFSLILYAIFFYPIIMYSIAFCYSSVLDLGTFVQIILIYCINKHYALDS